MSRLFVSDLDGTLLNAQAQLSEYARTQLLSLLASGTPFTIASARNVHTIAPIFEGVPLALPIIEGNGAHITDLRTQTPLLCHALPADIAEAVMRWGLQLSILPFVSTYVDGEQRLYPPLAVRNAGGAWYLDARRNAGDRRLRMPTEALATLHEPIVCLTFIDTKARLSLLEEQIRATYPGGTNTLHYENRYDPGWHWLTVQSVLATKACALRELTQMFGVALAETTVFGDDINDIPMFEVAGRGVAVENAIEPIKRIAHEIIGPHHQDSVIEYLRRER